MARITTAIRARVESILNSGVDTVNADSVNTGGIVDNKDSQEWETLREVGYETGDSVILPTISDETNVSTSSTSYGFMGDQWSLTIRWDKIAPSNGDLAIWFAVQGDPNTAIRIRNVSDDETALETTNTGTSYSGPQTYNPASPASTIKILPEIKSTNGNSTTVLSFTWGVTTEI